MNSKPLEKGLEKQYVACAGNHLFRKKNTGVAIKMKKKYFLPQRAKDKIHSLWVAKAKLYSAVQAKIKLKKLAIGLR